MIGYCTVVKKNYAFKPVRSAEKDQTQIVERLNDQGILIPRSKLKDHSTVNARLKAKNWLKKLIKNRMLVNTRFKSNQVHFRPTHDQTKKRVRSKIKNRYTVNTRFKS